MAFRCAIQVMGDLYASAVGTTVLQHKEIPTRPARYDGVVRLGGCGRGCGEEAIRSALGAFGQVMSCEMDLGSMEAVVRFTSQGEAPRSRPHQI